MNRNQKSPGLTIRHPAWRPAFERLNESLARGSKHIEDKADRDATYERLTRTRIALFGCVPI